jgi:hypothetical protein
MALEAGGVAQGASEVGFADSGGAEQDDVGASLQEAKLEKMLDLHAVDFLGPRPIPASHGFEDREAGGGQAPGDSAVMLGGAFPGGQDFQVGEVGGSGAGGLLGGVGSVRFHID